MELTERKPKCDSSGDLPVIGSPDTFTVDYGRKPLLYLPDGRVLVRRPGFRTEAK